MELPLSLHWFSWLLTRWLIFVCSYESGILEDPAHEGPDDLYQMTKDPKTSPDQPDKLEIHFKNGI